MFPVMEGPVTKCLQYQDWRFKSRDLPLFSFLFDLFFFALDFELGGAGGGAGGGILTLNFPKLFQYSSAGSYRSSTPKLYLTLSKNTCNVKSNENWFENFKPNPGKKVTDLAITKSKCAEINKFRGPCYEILRRCTFKIYGAHVLQQGSNVGYAKRLYVGVFHWWE